MWDFSTEPEFEQQLQWMREFTRAEVAPLDLVWPHHHHKAPAPWLKKVMGNACQRGPVATPAVWRR